MPEEKQASTTRSITTTPVSSALQCSPVLSLRDWSSQQRQNASVLQTPTAGQTASAAVGQQLAELGAEITRQNLNIQPTIKIREGYRFNVRVNRDMLFEAPYGPEEMR